jgi:hypothetical protein
MAYKIPHEDYWQALAEIWASFFNHEIGTAKREALRAALWQQHFPKE